MVALMIILCAVTLTYSVFLLARFGFKHKENDEYVSADKQEDKNTTDK